MLLFITLPGTNNFGVPIYLKSKIINKLNERKSLMMIFFGASFQEIIFR